MASRSRNGGRHVDNLRSPGSLLQDLQTGNRHVRRRAKALMGAAYAETRPRPRKPRVKPHH